MPISAPHQVTMAGRVLRPTPSSTEDLRPWQVQLTETLSQLHQECFEKRMALTKTVQEFPALYGSNAVDEIAFASQNAWNLNSDEAHIRAQELLAASPGDFSGTRLTCIQSWPFADESLWRGQSDNK